MARVLLTVWPFPTHLHPNFAVAEALRRRGHEVAFYTAGSTAPLIEKAGFRCFPFRSVDWNSVRDTVDQLLESAGRRGELRSWRKFLLDPIPAQLDDLDSVGREYPMDALVCDMSMWGPFLIWQEEKRIPATILSHVAYCLLGGTSNRIPGLTGLSQGSSRSRLRTLLTAVPARLMSAVFRRAANRLRVQRGLPPTALSVTDFGGSLPLYLVPSAPEFDERSDLPPSVHFVGPCLWDDPEDNGQPLWAEELKRTCVLVEEGGVFARGESWFLRQAVKAASSLTVPAVVLTGEGREPGTLSLGPLPPHVQVEPWTPLRHVLPHAAVMVSSGNSESVLMALQAGVPVIVAPSIREQMEVASRVEAAGVGLYIPRKKCTPERLCAAMKAVMADPSYRANALRIGGALAGRGGAARAAELIEEHLLRRSLEAGRRVAVE